MSGWQHFNPDGSPVGGGGNGGSSGGGYYQTLQIEDVAKTQRAILDLISGTGISLSFSDDSGGDRSKVTINASGSPYANVRISGSSTDPWADCSGATTLYIHPVGDGKVDVLVSGVRTTRVLSSALSINLSGATADKPYDVLIYDNSGTLAATTLVWTNASTRATAMVWNTTLNGFVKSGATDYRLIGSILIDSGGGAVTCDRGARNIWNLYNQIPMVIDCYIGTRNTTEYTTSSTSFTNVNGNSTLGAGKFSWMVGLPVKAVDLVWALTTLGADTTGVFATAAILLAGTGSGTVAQAVNTANASAGVPSSITIPMFYTPAAGAWSAQKQFKTFSNNARLQENGFIGVFWG